MDRYQDSKLKSLAVAGGVLLIIFGGYQILALRHFRVVGTNPKTSNVAAVSPFIKINFNHRLSPKGVSLSSSYSIIKSYVINGKTLTINLNSPMTADYAYYVEVNHIADDRGATIVNRRFSFTPKNIAWQNLSKEQQAALLRTQKSRPAAASVNFSGLDTLISYGVTSAQATSLQDYFMKFAPKAKTISVDKNSVVPAPHDRNSSSTLGTINFNVSVDRVLYAARTDYSLSTDYIRLVLQKPGGAQVFDSGTVLQGQGGE